MSLEELLLPANHLDDVGGISLVQLQHCQLCVDGVQQRRDFSDEFGRRFLCGDSGQRGLQTERISATEYSDFGEVVFQMRNHPIANKRHVSCGWEVAC